MATPLIILTLLVVVAAPILWIVLLIKRKTTLPGQIIGPIGPRHRDGALTYTEYRGIHSNVEVEDPRGSQSPRQQRRHSPRQHKQTKPWMK